MSVRRYVSERPRHATKQFDVDLKSKTRNEERGSRETKVRKRVSVQQVRERVDDEGDKVSRRSSAARMDP